MPEPEPLEAFVTGVAKETWALFRRDALVHVIAAAVVGILSILTLGVLAGALSVGYLRMVRRAARGETLEVGQVFDGLERFGASLAAVILIVLGIAIGLALLVVPGLLFGLFAMFALPVLAFEPLGAIDALRRSFTLVRYNFLNALVLLVVLSLLQSLGSSIVLGVLLSGPLSAIALAVAYNRVNRRALAPGASST